MISKYAAIHYLGTWDFDRDRGVPDGYERIRCSRWENDKLQCAGMTIDTRTGHARDDLSLERLIVIRSGKVLFENGFPNDTDVYLQVLTNEQGAFDFYLLTQRVYESNFNQMYFLGRFDASRFEMVLSDFPAARLFRFR
jgi:dolichyl-diphosphooligosaccharide--protein glycosyltransferase